MVALVDPARAHEGDERDERRRREAPQPGRAKQRVSEICREAVHADVGDGVAAREARPAERRGDHADVDPGDRPGPAHQRPSRRVATRAVPHAPIIERRPRAGAGRWPEARDDDGRDDAALRRKAGPRDGLHERLNHGCDQRCILSVTARSIASLRRARTRPKIARKPDATRAARRRPPRGRGGRRYAAPTVTSAVGRRVSGCVSTPRSIAMARGGRRPP